MADERAAAKAANRREKAAAAAAEDDDVEEDVGDRDDMEELSKREESEEKISTKKRDNDGRSRRNRSSRHPWIAHPGTIALISSLGLLVVLIFIYFLTPCKTAVDKLMPSKPLIGGRSSKKNFSRSNTSYNASPDGAPSSETVVSLNFIDVTFT